MTKITVHITKDVLKNTMYCIPEERTMECAIAYAIRDLFPEALTCCQDVYFDREQMTEAELPEEAVDFITRFDAATPIERCRMDEFDFVLEIPDEALQHIDISEVHRILEESKTLSLVK